MNDGPSEWEPSDEGRKQFNDNQSNGKVPDDPDPYYKVLRGGKRSFDLQCRELQLLYLSGEWWGLNTLWHDWEGRRWVLPYLLGWWKKETGRNLPDWIDKDI